MLNTKRIVKVETKRPPIYTAMKYWGKKPHNIWREYIEEFCEKGGVVLDPFAGCGMTAIEGLKANRNVVAFDINPLMTFTLDVFSTKFDENRLANAASKIVKKVSNDHIYKKFYTKVVDGNNFIIQNFKWERNKIYEIGLINDNEKKIIKECDSENILTAKMNKIKIKKWFPNKKISNKIYVTESFIKSIGGDNFANIWTKRNLYVLSEIFSLIQKEKDIELRLQLMYAFIQTVHLVSKMCVPRRENANRPFSTSWGRPAYLCANRQMELNPLLTFRNNCTGKQSVSSSLSSLCDYFSNNKSFNNVSNSYNIDKSKDINYGIWDAKRINMILTKKSIDLIITDPPYGGLIQYCDLSYIWNVWLEKYDKKYYTDFKNEITIKKNVKTENNYTDDLSLAIKNMHEVLRDNGKLIITFNNNDMSIWLSFLNSLKNGGFKIDNIVHQQNLRSSESNVSNDSGISSTDYYLICSKSLNNANLIKSKSINIQEEIYSILEARNEDTSINVIIDHFINILINDDNIKLPNNLLDKIKNTKTNKMYYCSISKSFKLVKYNSNKKSLSEKIHNDMEKLTNNSITFNNAQVYLFNKYKSDLRPEIKQIKRIYNEVIQ